MMSRRANRYEGCVCCSGLESVYCTRACAGSVKRCIEGLRHDICVLIQSSAPVEAEDVDVIDVGTGMDRLEKLTIHSRRVEINDRNAC
jgi:hypothetical protein